MNRRGGSTIIWKGWIRNNIKLTHMHVPVTPILKYLFQVIGSSLQNQTLEIVA
jgi:hypothetical protein